MIDPSKPGQATPPFNDLTSVANRFWTNVDQRIEAVVRRWATQRLGVPRNRSMTINVPLADATGLPEPGWLHSIHMLTPARITAWQIHAFSPGTIQLDIQLSTMQTDPATAPTYISLPNTNYPTLNGYTAFDYDLANWSTDIPAGGVLHIFVLSVSDVTQATLGIQLVDRAGRLLQVA